MSIVQVLCDEVGLDGFDDLDRDEQRDWDYVLECNETRAVRDRGISE